MMDEVVRIQVRVGKALRYQTADVFHGMGFDSEAAIAMFLG